MKGEAVSTSHLCTRTCALQYPKTLKKSGEFICFRSETGEEDNDLVSLLLFVLVSLFCVCVFANLNLWTTRFVAMDLHFNVNYMADVLTRLQVQILLALLIEAINTTSCV